MTGGGISATAYLVNGVVISATAGLVAGGGISAAAGLVAGGGISAAAAGGGYDRWGEVSHHLLTVGSPRFF